LSLIGASAGESASQADPPLTHNPAQITSIQTQTQKLQIFFSPKNSSFNFHCSNQLHKPTLCIKTF
jgi:hypothetical protein